MNTKETNPKDALAADRVPLHLWPPVASAHGAMAIMTGAIKYGRNNWRKVGVRASVYKSAIERHLNRWFEGQDLDESGCHHLAHVLACAAIVLDAKAAGKLADDRNEDGGYAEELAELTECTAQVREKAETAKRIQEYHNCRVKRPSWGNPAETAAPAIADAAETMRKLIPEIQGFRFKPCVCGECPTPTRRSDGIWTIDCSCTEFPKITAVTLVGLAEEWNKAIRAKNE